MNTLIITLLATSLIGCSAPAFHPTENRTDVKLTIIKRDNLPSPYDAPNLKMYGTFYCKNDKECTIWIPTGNSACAREVELHEKLHVRFGLFHDADFNLKNCG